MTKRDQLPEILCMSNILDSSQCVRYHEMTTLIPLYRTIAKTLVYGIAREEGKFIIF
jgi:hypothetical protein